MKTVTTLLALMAIPALWITGCGSSGTTGQGTDGGTVADAPAAGQEDGSPPGGDGAGASGAVGDPCTSADTCPAGGSGTTECITDWPGGYCAVADCTQHGHDCPNDPGQGGTATTGGKCVLSPTAKCLALCASNADCRDGYECAPRGDAAGHGNANVCVPVAGGNAMTDGGSQMGDGGGAMGDGGGEMGDGGMGGDGGDMMGGDGGMGGGM
ncbi:MAG TPA: hypothetical protein VGQ83_39045 [Polyangia bacterium]